MVGERGLAGEIFKKRREELGIEIKEVSDALKISAEYISAIENGIFDKLPVAVYSIGYIRNYAHYLGIDAEPIIQNFKSHLISPNPSTIIPVSSSRRGFSKILYALCAIPAGALIFSVFLYTANHQIDSKTSEKSTLSGKASNPTFSSPVAANSVSEKTPAKNDLQEAKLNEAVPAVVEKSGHLLDIKALETVWLQVRFADGKVEEMILRSGAYKHWEFNGSVMLKIGNAGGLTLKFDGKDLGIPGKSGQVLNLNFPPG